MGAGSADLVTFLAAHVLPERLEHPASSNDTLGILGPPHQETGRRARSHTNTALHCPLGAARDGTPGPTIMSSSQTTVGQKFSRNQDPKVYISKPHKSDPHEDSSFGGVAIWPKMQPSISTQSLSNLARRPGVASAERLGRAVGTYTPPHNAAPPRRLQFTNIAPTSRRRRPEMRN